MLTIEEDTAFEPVHCDCCGQKSHSISGWVNEDSATVAAYLVHWTETRPDHGANFDLIIGSWGEDTNSTDRQAASFKYSSSGGGFMAIDASSRPFANDSTLFDQALSREEIVGSPLSSALYNLLDAIWLQDSRIAEIQGGG